MTQRCFIKNFPDDLFCCLWVAKNDKGGDLRKDLGFSKSLGITNTDKCAEIRLQYKKFLNNEFHLPYNQRLEHFFNLNFAIIERFSKKLLTFSYSSESWLNMKFIYQKRHRKPSYIKLDLLSILPILAKSDSIINLPINDIWKLYGKTTLAIPFNFENWVQWCDHLERTIIVYELNEEGKIQVPINQVSPCVKSSKLDPIRLIVDNRDLFEEGQGHYKLLANSKIVQTAYTCITKGCYFSHFLKVVLTRHMKSCREETEISTEQITYGNPESILEKGVRLGYVPKWAVNFRQKYLVTFDIECLESDFEGDRVGMSLNIEKCQKLVSLAVGSNLEGAQPKFFCRSSSDPSTEQILIDEFVDHLEQLYAIYTLQLPAFIKKGIEQIEKDLIDTSFGHRKCEMQSVLGHLKKYCKLRIYAFNAGKYDIPCIFPALINSLRKSRVIVSDKWDTCFLKNFSFIKKGAQYFCLQTEQFVFNDTLHFTSPCSYAQFLKQWGVSEKKSIFPYQLFSNIEQMEATIDFPSHASFHSDLTESNVSLEDYNISKCLYESRQKLPQNHPDKIHNMKCWLKYYNTIDVVPLATAMDTCFECFHSYFEQDGNCQLSLPGIASTALYRNYDQHCSYIFGFRQKNNAVRSKHRDTLCGGLVNCFHR